MDIGQQPSTKEQIIVCHECNDATTQHNQQSHQKCICIHVIIIHNHHNHVYNKHEYHINAIPLLQQRNYHNITVTNTTQSFVRTKSNTGLTHKKYFIVFLKINLWKHLTSLILSHQNKVYFTGFPKLQTVPQTELPNSSYEFSKIKIKLQVTVLIG